MLNNGTLYVGGGFNALGGLPQAHFGCIVQEATLDVPWSRPVAELAMRVSPNPTNGPVRIEYDLPAAARVSIGVYDVQGRRIGPAIEAAQLAGTHTASWTAPEGTAAGIYFVRMNAGPLHMVRRLVRL
jgi:hypothetical protein